MLKLTLILTIMIASRNACAQAVVKSVPIEIIDNDIFVKAFVNGRGPFNFVLDTGASGIGRLDSRIVEELKLSAVDSTKNFDGSGKYQMVPVIRVDTLQIGEIKVDNVDLLSRNYNINPKMEQVLTDGIIGRDFFQKYILVIDAPNGRISYSTGSLKKSDKGVMDYDEPFKIKGKIGDSEQTFHIDTGSNLSMHTPKSIVELLAHSDTVKQSIARKANSEYTIKETILNDPIYLGNTKSVNTHVYYSETATFINVGMRFLKSYKLSIDQRNKLLKIE